MISNASPFVLSLSKDERRVVQQNRMHVEAHPTAPFFALSGPLTTANFPLSASLQPNSTWPRIRDPAATVRELPLRSPMSCAVSKSSTCELASTLPSPSPP